MATTMKLELVFVPVTDVDRAKAFYVDKLGFNADYDESPAEDIRFVQLTPHGSACSIAIGKGLTDMEPGSVKGLQLVVDDAQETRDELLSKGAEPTEIDPQPWGKFVSVADPDGNTLVFQQLPSRN